MATWTDVISVEQIEAAQAIIESGIAKQHIQGTVIQLTVMVPENGTYILPDEKRTTLHIKDGVATLVVSAGRVAQYDG